MLLELSVKNFGIIEEMRWCVGHDLNVVTGETGAGKSLVVDAVEALLAGKTGAEDIRHGADAAGIEGIFDPGFPWPTRLEICSVASQFRAQAH